MESLNYSLKNTDVNIVLRDCVNYPHNNKYLVKIKQDPDWLVENCQGIIDATLFQMLITKAKSYHSILDVVIQTIDYATENDISDTIFNMIMTFPQKDKDNLIIPLSHKSLSEKQLIILCNYGITFEPFYELAIKYYISDIYDIKQFVEFIANFKKGKYGYLYEDMMRELSCYKTNCLSKEMYLLNELKDR